VKASDSGRLASLEERVDLFGSVAAVTAERAHGMELAGVGPSGDRLGVHVEEQGYFAWGEQVMGLHVASLMTKVGLEISPQAHLSINSASDQLLTSPE